MNGVPFDHFLQSGFSLIRHQKDYPGDLFTCADCHTSEDGIKVDFVMNFCTDCHRINNPDFMTEHQIHFGKDCLACHDGIDRMADFDHDHSFVLDGKHAEIPCESCHTNKVFGGTPTACEGCHGEPAIHAGYFGQECENCHASNAWAPAKMKSHFFPLDHGDHGQLACEACHITRYTEYTCYGCHEHDPEAIRKKHQDEGITGTRLTDCMACHPDGLEHKDE
jgi:hypothetical protein